MANHRALALLLAAGFLLAAGCVGSRGANEPRPVAGSTPENTFATARDALLGEDPAKMFDCYSDNKKNQEGGLEVFKQNFARNRPQMLALFTGSRVTFVAVEKEQATAVILWGNGERWPPVSFVLERNLWKIDK